MKLSTLLTTSVLALTLGFPALSLASNEELGRPVIELMPHFKELRAQLNLNAEQDKVVDAWMAEAPKKRQALEAETIAVKQQLRDALLNRDDRLKREQLKEELMEKTNRMIEMRSLCARMLNDTLTAEQYATVVSAYRDSLK